MCVCVRALERVVSLCVTLRVCVCVYVYVWLGGALSTAFPALSHCVCDTLCVCVCVRALVWVGSPICGAGMRTHAPELHIAVSSVGQLLD